VTTLWGVARRVQLRFARRWNPPRSLLCFVLDNGFLFCGKTFAIPCCLQFGVDDGLIRDRWPRGLIPFWETTRRWKIFKVLSVQRRIGSHAGSNDILHFAFLSLSPGLWNGQCRQFQLIKMAPTNSCGCWWSSGAAFVDSEVDATSTSHINLASDVLTNANEYGSYSDRTSKLHLTHACAQPAPSQARGVLESSNCWA
jgi:hypothetical protein